MRRAFAPQAKALAALSALRDSEARGALNRRNIDLRPERGLGDGDGNFHVDIVFLAGEVRMRSEPRDDVKVSRGAAGDSRAAFCLETNAGAVIDAGRNRHGQVLG